MAPAKSVSKAPKVEKEEAPKEEARDENLEMDISITNESQPIDPEAFDLDSFISNVQEESAAEEILPEEPEQPAIEPPDEIDQYDYKEYSDLIKNINQYKTNSDNSGYKKWMLSSSNIEKSIISLRIHISKEKLGETINWDSVYQTISPKAEFTEIQLEKLKIKIQHFEDVKQILNQVINQFKSSPPNTLNFVKTNWTSILNSFNVAPDYQSVRETIEQIIYKADSSELQGQLKKVIIKSIEILENKLTK